MYRDWIVVATLLVVMVPAAFAAAQCPVNMPFGVVDLAEIPVATLPVTEYFDGNYRSRIMVVSLCEAVSKPPQGFANCSAGPSFVSEYAGDVCLSAWNSRTSQWIWDNNTISAEAWFVNVQGWTARVAVMCGARKELQVVGVVGVSPSMSYTIQLSSSLLCGSNPVTLPVPTNPPAPTSCSVQTPWGNVDMTQIPVAQLPIEQNFLGALSMFTWIVSLCMPYPLSTSCPSFTGFLGQYSSYSCTESWNSSTGFVFNAARGAAQVDFISPNGDVATVVIGCGATAQLQADGDVMKYWMTNQINYQSFLTLSSSVMCQGSPTASPYTLRPNPAPFTPAPSPFPANSLRQTTCNDFQCSVNCVSAVIPLGTCVGLTDGGSIIAACTSTEAILTTFPFSTNCSGAVHSASMPLDQCLLDETTGDYIESRCVLQSSAIAQGKRVEVRALKLKGLRRLTSGRH